MSIWSLIAQKALGGTADAIDAYQPVFELTADEEYRQNLLKKLREKGQGLTDQERAVLESTLMSPIQASAGETQQRLGQNLATVGAGPSDLLRGQLGLQKQVASEQAGASRTLAAADIEAQKRRDAELAQLATKEQTAEKQKNANTRAIISSILNTLADTEQSGSTAVTQDQQNKTLEELGGSGGSEGGGDSFDIGAAAQIISSYI